MKTQRNQLYGVVEGSVPNLETGGLPTTDDVYTVECVLTGPSGVAEVAITSNLGDDLPPAAIASDVPIPLGIAGGTLTLTFTILYIGDRFIVRTHSTGEMDYAEIFIGENWKGAVIPIKVNREGELRVNLEVSDIEIGAVEIKDASSDNRADVNDALTARTTGTHVLAVQNIDAEGHVPDWSDLEDIKVAVQLIASNAGSLHEIIQDCNDHTDFTAYGDAANLADSANHITGSVAVLWDKTLGSNVSSGVEDTITALDLSPFSPNDYVMVTVHIPDLTDVASVGLLLGTDNGNYNRWEWADTDLTAGAWNVLLAPISEGTMVALGWDQSVVTWVALEVIFDNAADTLNTMVVDQISAITAESIGVTMESGATDLRTQRVTVATDDTVATDLTAINTKLVSGMFLPSATHWSPKHFTAVFTSSTTLTLAGLSFPIIDSSQLAYIVQITAGNTSARWINSDNCTLTEAGGVVTIHGAGTPFVVGDQYRVGINNEYVAYDQTQDAMKGLEQSPSKDWYTDPEDYTTFTATTIAYVEGGVISVETYHTLNFAWSKTSSDLDNSYIKVIYLDDSGSAVDYQEIALGNLVGGVTQIVSHIYEVDKAAGVNIISFFTKGFPFMRIDIAKATDTGTDAVFTTKINKVWGN